ncbi:MAG: hypothetical protein JWN66_4188 [Sphingomonas bacterium]|uniref:DUF2065 domain-containing protein n=1 Tax=Sphingomonas bacterium TaxID=1895847 RepID=UPI002616714A|nr:DUF2065 domain-containing protein [Sphingomonas bacterium]MDB5707072.1 hypothetical protein [Sphingomonas bacterium]
MTIHSPTTALLATLIGAYLIATGLGGLVNQDRWRRALEEFAASPALLLIAGAVGFIAGAAIIGVHNRWSDPLAVAVSLVGWSAMAKGLGLIVLQDRGLHLTRPLATATRIWAIVVLVLGLAFLIAGLTAKPIIY